MKNPNPLEDIRRLVDEEIKRDAFAEVRSRRDTWDDFIAKIKLQRPDLSDELEKHKYKPCQ